VKTQRKVCFGQITFEFPRKIAGKKPAKQGIVYASVNPGISRFNYFLFISHSPVKQILQSPDPLVEFLWFW